MFQVSKNIQVLCGALADQTAREDRLAGVFTGKLVALLQQPDGASYLTLPINLEVWHEALPINLLEQTGVSILDRRDVLGTRDEQNERHVGPETRSQNERRPSQQQQAS